MNTVPTHHTLQEWVLFHVVILALLLLDLGVLNRKAHVIHVKEALGWSAFWIALGLGFGGWINYTLGHQAATEYLTGYVVEKSLSIDNLFVFLVIFRAFSIQKQHQHRLLFWGVLGAIVLRGAMIAAGAQLLESFHWIIYVFGAFLIYTGYQLFRSGDKQLDPHASPVLKFFKRHLPFSDRPHPGHFWVTENGMRKFTMSFAALILIESSDVVFALDSVPAVFGVTRDPYLVYTSNIFAILGLRSLFFVLEDFMDRFHLLKYGLAVVLCFVGLKMCADAFVHISSGVSLMVVCGILAGSVAASLARPKRH